METQLSFNRAIWAPNAGRFLYCVFKCYRNHFKICSRKFVYDIRTGVGSGFGAIGEIGSCAAIALTARGEPLSLRYSASRVLINPDMCHGKEHEEQEIEMRCSRNNKDQ